mgnify:CR=1 FL=1
MTFGFTIFDWFDFWLIFSADEKMEFFNRTFFSNRKNKTNKWGKSSLNNLHKEKNVNGGDHCHGHLGLFTFWLFVYSKIWIYIQMYIQSFNASCVIGLEVFQTKQILFWFIYINVFAYYYLHIVLKLEKKTFPG